MGVEREYEETWGTGILYRLADLLEETTWVSGEEPLRDAEVSMQMPMCLKNVCWDRG
jgi:hypothetical protein